MMLHRLIAPILVVGVVALLMWAHRNSRNPTAEERERRLDDSL